MRKGFGKARRSAICAALIALAAALLIGCGASVTVYDYTRDGIRYNEYEITVEKTAMAAIEQTAATDADGNKYTLPEYLYALFTEFGYELLEATDTDVEYTARYRKAIYGRSELDIHGTAVEFTATSTSNPFVRTITSTSPGPFNGVRKAYDEMPSGASSTMLERLKNGLVVHNEYGDTENVFPALETAFPYIRGENRDGLLLKYARVGSDRMKSSGVAVPLGNRTVRYEFSRYFDESESQITFEYKRPVPYGWYLIALLAGACVLVAVMYIAVKKQLGKTSAVARRTEAEDIAQNRRTEAESAVDGSQTGTEIKSETQQGEINDAQT